MLEARLYCHISVLCILRSFPLDFIYKHSDTSILNTDLSYHSSRFVSHELSIHSSSLASGSTLKLILRSFFVPYHCQLIFNLQTELTSNIFRSPACLVRLQHAEARFVFSSPEVDMSSCCSCRVTRSAFTTRSFKNLPTVMFQNILSSKPSSSESRHGCEGNWLGSGAKVSHKAYGA